MPNSLIATPLGTSRPRPTPIARSAWPVTSASHVPVRTSVRSRRRVGGADAASASAGAAPARAPTPRPTPTRRSRRPRLHRALGVERAAQVEHRRARDDVVDGDAELRLPAGGDPLDAVRDRVHLVEQAAAFVEQLAAGGGQRRLARAAVEQQHVERVLELAHVVGQRRRHLAELARRRGEAAAARDRVHHRQRVGRQDVARLGAGGGSSTFILFE